MPNYGIKVSKDGFNVKTTDAENLVMSSAFNLLKTLATGTLSSNSQFSHGQSYVPILFAINKKDTPSWGVRHSAVWGTQIVGADSTNLDNSSNDTIRYYLFYQDSV